jgi:hypothetical protein
MGHLHDLRKYELGRLIEERGWLLVSVVATGMGGTSVSDVLACGPGGIFIAAEIKTEEDKPDPKDPRWIRQQRFLKKVERLGGIAVWDYTPRAIMDEIDQELGRRGLSTEPATEPVRDPSSRPFETTFRKRSNARRSS